VTLPEGLPTRRELASIYEALLHGELSRESVVAWCKALQKAGDWKYGPPLRNEEGYWEFLTLLWLKESTNPRGELRTMDLQEILAELNDEPGETVDGFERLRVHQKTGLSKQRICFSIHDPEGTVQLRIPLGLRRAVIDNLGDLRENLAFRLGASVFLVERVMYEDHFEFLYVHHEPDVRVDDLGALVTHLELDWSHVLSHDERRAILERQDDNGNTFVIREFTDVLEALCERAKFERLGHRQLYTVRLL